MIGQVGKRGLIAAAVILFAASAFGVACNDDDDGGDASPTAAANTPPAGATPAATSTPEGEDVLGETPGWAGGQTGTVFYTKDFFANTDPAVAGADGSNPPGVSDPVPTVWVLVPLFDDKEGIELHCPTAGECVAHPDMIDVSAVNLGQVIPLPPHSHIIDPAEAGFDVAGSTPWDVVVVGVMTRAAWDQLQAGKSIETLRQVQQDQTAATADVPTNVVLFFGVR
jgi:hypothetical protein